MKAENKIIKCIESCTTTDQLISCLNLVSNYAKYKINKVTLISFLLDNNIYTSIRLMSEHLIEKIHTRFYQILFEDIVKNKKK